MYFENKRRELVINTVESLSEQINRTVKQMLKGVKKELKRIRSLAEDVGLETAASTVIDPQSESVENPEKIEAEFGMEVLAGVTRRITGLTIFL